MFALGSWLMEYRDRRALRKQGMTSQITYDPNRKVAHKHALKSEYDGHNLSRNNKCRAWDAHQVAGDGAQAAASARA